VIHAERVKDLNSKPVAEGRYVLYWMQQAQRAHFNHAFEFAIERANELGKPLVVFFGLTPKFPRANANHYRFMLEGLCETAEAVRERGASFLVQPVSPEKGAVALAKSACEVVCDRGYIKIQRRWRERMAKGIKCRATQVESDVVVPVEAAMEKQAYSAAVLRPKVERLLDRYMVPLRRRRLKSRPIKLDTGFIDLKDIDGALKMLRVKSSPALAGAARGGRKEALARLRRFVRSRLAAYDADRNDPNKAGTSELSPYLHFGQISPLEVALEVNKVKAQSSKLKGGAKPFLEELIVRRELAMNFAFYNPHYDSFEGISDWAKKALAAHKKDRREFVYTKRQLERATTHDPYWNAAQRQMALTGRMHGYMRMYWGKKVIEWTRDPAEAFRILVELNDRYELDGRDPNGYAGISWCFGTHDRPWGQRRVFGGVRYMNDSGLRRKFDADAYVEMVEGLTPRAP